MSDTNGPVIRWDNLGCEGWMPRSYPDVRAALEDQHFTTEFVITRLVDFEVVEKKGPSPQSAGGRARAAALTPKRRVEIATKAANARWIR